MPTPGASLPGMDPVIINGMTYRDWHYALGRLLAEANPLGIAPPWHRARQCWTDGYTPAQAFLLWQEETPEAQRIA